MISRFQIYIYKYNNLDCNIINLFPDLVYLWLYLSCMQVKTIIFKTSNFLITTHVCVNYFLLFS